MFHLHLLTSDGSAPGRAGEAAFIAQFHLRGGLDPPRRRLLLLLLLMCDCVC